MIKLTTYLLSVALILVTFYSPVRSAIINVPDDIETIYWALGISDDGDTILVQPGVYEEVVVFAGEAVTLASLYLTTGDPAYIDSTIIQPQAGRAIYMDHDEGYDTRITGFTLQGGSGNYGGGIYLSGSSPTISNLIIQDNEGGFLGGGVYCTQGGRPIFQNCTIRNNYTSGSGGGVASAHGARPTYDHCEIYGNEAALKGGGVFAGHGDGSIALSFVELSYNKADSGAGIFVNTTYTPSATNLTITRNEGEIGSGILMAAGGEEGGLSYFRVSNSIIWDNDYLQVVTVTYRRDDTGLLEFRYSDLPEINDHYIADSCRYVLTHCISDNPEFLNSDARNFQLAEDSPCIDAGDPDAQLDPDSTRVDMGAYPYDQRLSVDSGGSSISPAKISLIRAYPNPFNATLNIELWDTHSAGTLNILDLSGRSLGHLEYTPSSHGSTLLKWDASRYPAGTYIIQQYHPLNPTAIRVHSLK